MPGERVEAWCLHCGVVQAGTIYPRWRDRVTGCWMPPMVIVHCSERECGGVSRLEMEAGALLLSRAAFERADLLSDVE